MPPQHKALHSTALRYEWGRLMDTHLHANEGEDALAWPGIRGIACSICKVCSKPVRCLSATQQTALR